MFLRTTSSALAVLALTSPVFADVTPAEVWQNWIDYYTANGYTVTEGARDEAGETLTVRDVVIAFADPAGEAKLDFTLPEVTLTATGAGGVRTTMAETSPATMVFKNEDDEEVTLKGEVTMKDAEIVSTGAAADMTHESRAGEVLLALNSVTTAEGEKAVPVSVKLLNMTGTQHVVDGQNMQIDATMAADRMELAGEYDDSTGEEPGKAVFSGGMDALKFAGNFVVPKGVDISKDMNAALKAGMNMSGTMSVGAGAFDFDFAGKNAEGADQNAKGSSTMEGFQVSGGLSADGLKYQGSSDATAIEMTISDAPFPISYAVESGTFDMQIPVMKSDQPAPFKFAYSLGGLTLADGIWDLFDPANMAAMEDAAAPDGTDTAAAAPDAEDATPDAAAPDAAEDPATAMDESAGTPSPFEPTEITINKLALDAVGARIDASGNLTVPEGGSIEAPVGKLNARFEGVNGLIDKLQAMGFIPEDQVAGVRMMLAMFAKPAPEGGDALVSEFEFQEGGQIFANGQQVR